MKNHSSHKGFTLVELAIVLVIIGLLVGGILQGQELIKRAEIQKQIELLNSVKLGFATFQAKYDALPGDIKRPERFFPVCNNAAYSSPGQIYTGNGDGMIDSAPVVGGEYYCVWQHLHHSGMFYAAGLKASELDVGGPPVDINFENISFPYTRWPVGHRVFTFVVHGSMDYTGVHQLNWNMLVATGAEKGLSPMTVHAIDSKIDDGKPGTGAIVAASWPGGPCYDDIHPTAPSNNFGLPSIAANYYVNETAGICDLMMLLK